MSQALLPKYKRIFYNINCHFYNLNTINKFRKQYIRGLHCNFLNIQVREINIQLKNKKKHVYFKFFFKIFIQYLLKAIASLHGKQTFLVTKMSRMSARCLGFSENYVGKSGASIVRLSWQGIKCLPCFELKSPAAII